MQINYTAPPTIAKFHQSDLFVREVMGPFGSGKSVGCCMEVMSKICTIPPCDDGWRRSRWAIVRNSYRELRDTTINTWQDWVPQELGTFKWSTMTHHLHFNDVKAEVLFRALDKPSDIGKLLSLELTGGWLNEAREIPKAIFDAIQGRIGRYPNRRMQKNKFWFGLIVDTNPPDHDHYLYKIMEEQKPDGYVIFKQPSGLSDQAENIQNLPENYYTRMAQGKDPEWVNVYCHGKYGFVLDGKAIHPLYKDEFHSPADIGYNPNLPLYLGLDFGLTPACVFFQKRGDGGVDVIDELVTEDMGATRFAKKIRERLSLFYDGRYDGAWGDPAGEQRSQTDESTPFQILYKEGLPAIKTYTNDFTIRTEAVNNCLSSVLHGLPYLRIAQKCRYLRKGLSGGYKYRRLQVSGEFFADKPDKNMYSHVCEALQYGLLGVGEGITVVANKSMHKPRVRRGMTR